MFLSRYQWEDILNRIVEIDKLIAEQVESLQKQYDGEFCFPFLGLEINASAVDNMFEDLKDRKCNGSLHVIIDSYGGDIHAAYNLAMLFRRYGKEKLEFIIPRFAKSAATLLVCFW